MTATLTRPAVVPGTRRVRLGFAVVGAVALSIVALVAYHHANSETSEQRAESALVSLTPVLPDLGSGQAVVISHPLCEPEPRSCTSAERTWSVNGSSTLADLDRAVSAWAMRNHLRNQGGWDCGLNQDGLFGQSGSGCVTSFTGPGSKQSTFVATTLTDQAALRRAVGGYPNGLANPLPALGDQSLASLSVQVVE